MPISSTILWQDKISMSRARQQFTNTGQIHQSDVNMTDTIPFPCHLSTTGTDKTVNHRPIRQSTANPYTIPIPANASVKCKNTLNTLAICICICIRCSQMILDVPRCFQMFLDVPRCSQMFLDDPRFFSRCSQMFPDVLR